MLKMLYVIVGRFLFLAGEKTERGLQLQRREPRESRLALSSPALTSLGESSVSVRSNGDFDRKPGEKDK